MGGKSGSKAAAREAAAARQAEEKRQAAIKSGTANINAIFDHGQRGGLLSADTAFDPNGTYFNEDGSRWTPQVAKTPQELMSNPSSFGDVLMGLFGASHNTVKSPEEQFREALASGKLYGGSGGFNNDFYDGIARNYLEHANPQLEKQHAEANKQLTFDLARTGKLDSSTRATKGADLQEAYNLNQQQIADKALGIKNSTKNAVEDARSALISQVNATGDATGATNAALSRAAALSAPAGNYDTLSNLFADFTGSLGNRYAQERAYTASGGAGAKGYTPVFATRTGAVKVSG